MCHPWCLIVVVDGGGDGNPTPQMEKHISHQFHTILRLFQGFFGGHVFLFPQNIFSCFCFIFASLDILCHLGHFSDTKSEQKRTFLPAMFLYGTCLLKHAASTLISPFLIYRWACPSYLRVLSFNCCDQKHESDRHKGSGETNFLWFWQIAV